MAEHWAPGLVPSPTAEKAIRRAMDGSSTLVLDLPAMSRSMSLLSAEARRAGLRLLHTVKASSLPVVLREASKHGLGFDVSNQREWATVTSALGHGHVISLTPSTLPPGELAWAGQMLRTGKIARLHVDSVRQLETLVSCTSPGPIGLRLNIRDDAWPPDVPARRVSRFGVPEEATDAVLDVVNRTGHQVAWLHLHNASEKNNADSFTQSLKLMLHRAAAFGGTIRQVNLGGGLPNLPAHELGGLFGSLTRAAPDVEIVLEPGRWWSRGSVSLVTQILDIKVGPRCVFVVINTGSESRRWSVPTMPTLGPDPHRPDLPYVLCGVSAYEQDYFGQVTPDPDADVPKVGDWLVLGGLSTYSVELSTNFNGLRTDIIVVEE
ncbi:hypothetical protein Nm8I071_55290 [Nonomuraea sp. TT08I-71]|nr:hypothetical protein Nm8I071_55290 [Nonomuraea sp. TT08I-71]